VPEKVKEKSKEKSKKELLWGPPKVIVNIKTIRGFPTMGATPQWMLYHGNSCNILLT